MSKEKRRDRAVVLSAGGNGVQQQSNPAVLLIRAGAVLPGWGHAPGLGPSSGTSMEANFTGNRVRWDKSQTCGPELSFHTEHLCDLEQGTLCSEIRVPSTRHENANTSLNVCEGQ